MVTFSDSPPVVTEQDVLAVETAGSFRFPEVYRDFLLKTNGGIPSRKSIAISPKAGTLIRAFLGICTNRYRDLRRYLSARGNTIPPELCPIAYDWGGSYICIYIAAGERYGQIFFWDREYQQEEGYGWSNVRKIADGFAELLAALYER